jgi:hypothetical protein
VRNATAGFINSRVISSLCLHYGLPVPPDSASVKEGSSPCPAPEQSLRSVAAMSNEHDTANHESAQALQQRHFLWTGVNPQRSQNLFLRWLYPPSRTEHSVTVLFKCTFSPGAGPIDYIPRYHELRSRVGGILAFRCPHPQEYRQPDANSVWASLDRQWIQRERTEVSQNADGRRVRKLHSGFRAHARRFGIRNAPIAQQHAESGYSLSVRNRSWQLEWERVRRQRSPGLSHREFVNCVVWNRGGRDGKHGDRSIDEHRR